MPFRILIWFAVFCCVSVTRAQVWESPVSRTFPITQEINSIALPPIDKAKIEAEDALTQGDKYSPWRYGVVIPLEIVIGKQGQWETLPNGDRLWRLEIHSKEALNLSLNFSAFQLPQGAHIYLFNADFSEVSKKFTSADNAASLGTWFLSGDTVFLEYYEPFGVQDTADIALAEVVHGYRMGAVHQFVEAINSDKGLNDSGACQWDVSCSIDTDFNAHKEMAKKAVALLNLGNGLLCSAVLLNNAASDKTPYLLTANHCLTASDPTLWSVRFNWTSPNPQCGTGLESTNRANNYTLSGASLRANNAASDFALVELNQPIPQNWDVAFAGWDRSDVIPEYTVGIHHPKGDIMKVCQDLDAPAHDVANNTEVWLIKGASAGSGNGWEIGTTEEGSSGSPLFNNEGKLIGQLYGGTSNCEGTSTNGEFDVYGRFAVSWEYGSTAQTRLKEWLDPFNTQAVEVETLQNTLTVPDFENALAFSVYPNPAQDFVTVYNTQFSQLQYTLYNVQGQAIQKGALRATENRVSLESLPQGIYLIHFLDTETQEQSTHKIVHVNRL